jgi:hypothetical protein
MWRAHSCARKNNVDAPRTPLLLKETKKSNTRREKWFQLQKVDEKPFR